MNKQELIELLRAGEYVSGADSARAGTLLFCDSSDGTSSATWQLEFTAKDADKTADAVLSFTSVQIVAYGAMAPMKTNESSLSVRVIPEHDHLWDEAVYVWSEDFFVCSASHNCTVCGLAEYDETVAVRTEIPASCTEPGSVTYTAVFFEDLFESRSMTFITDPASGHDWGEAVFTWSQDHLTCSAVRVCADCGAEERETASANVTVTREATLTQEGERVFNAVFTNPAFPAQSEREVIPHLFLWGDANGDGEISNKDVVRLKNYLANYDEEMGVSSVEIFPGADANGDGAVSNKDIIRLKNYLANYDEETGLSGVTLGPAV